MPLPSALGQLGVLLLLLWPEAGQRWHQTCTERTPSCLDFCWTEEQGLSSSPLPTVVIHGRKMDPMCSARSVEVNQPPTSTLLLLIWLQFLWGHFFSIGFLTSDQNWSQLTPDTYMVIFWNKASWYRFGSALLLRQTIESHPCKQEIPGNS